MMNGVIALGIVMAAIFVAIKINDWHFKILEEEVQKLDLSSLHANGVGCIYVTPFGRVIVDPIAGVDYNEIDLYPKYEKRAYYGPDKSVYHGSEKYPCFPNMRYEREVLSYWSCDVTDPEDQKIVQKLTETMEWEGGRCL